MMIASTNAEVCEVNEHGSYGIYTFYNNVDKIHFYYQLEYDTDIDNDTDLHNMQDALEREISNDILQTTSLAKSYPLENPVRSDRLVPSLLVRLSSQHLSSRNLNHSLPV